MSFGTGDIDYSIVICTYNPDNRILERCLEAVSQLDRNGIATETILVDNNSNTPVSSLPYVQNFGKKIQDFKPILVQEQGVNFARMAAIDMAKGKYIVYIDYDNEPASNYLQQLKKLNADYPQVGAWGPGNVSVDFLDGVAKNIELYAKNAFQERHETVIHFAQEKEWQACYPFGTGLCTHTFILKEYNVLARQGKLTLSGRKGNKLTSGEDTQMVLICISKGYAAGVSPSLQLTHMIPATRANKNYLQRLAFGTGLSYESCLMQIFPEHKSVLEKNILPPDKFSRKTVKKYIAAKFSSNPHKLFYLCQYIGMHASAYLALNRPLPSLVNKIIKYLKLE